MSKNKMLISYFVLVLLILQGCVAIDLDQIIKSKSDNRTYKAIRLQNQLQCIIIYDKQANKSSAALSVAVGGLQDPIQAQGLTNVLMHMLMAGSKKYPKQNQFGQFVSKNGGMYDAFCSDQTSTIFFQVASNAFKGALDRLSSLIKSPLLTKQILSKSIQSVDSGFSAFKQNDMMRKLFMNKYISRQDSPFKKFTIGNKESLSDPKLYDMIMNRFETRFSSNIMKLVVYTNQQPSKTQQLIKQYFQQIPNKKAELFKLKEIPYSQKAYGKCIKILPINDVQQISIHWILQNKSSYYQNPPGEYIAYIFNQQSPGSLSSFLVQQGLIQNLKAGSYDQFNTYTRFVVQFKLTKKGVKNYKKVISYALFFVKNLLQISPKEYIFTELKNLKKMNFDYREMTEGINYVISLALQMLKIQKISEIFTRDFFMKDWKPNLITEFLKEMTSNNMFVLFLAKDFLKQCNLQQKYYKIKYGIQDIKNIQPLNYPFILPPKNSYIPTNLQVLPLAKKSLPSLIYSVKQLNVYYKEDHQFALPKVIFNFRLHFKGNNTVRQTLSRKIFEQMLNQRLRTMTSMGKIGGIFSSISFISYYTCQVSLVGFRDSILKFIDSFIYILLSFEPTDLQLFQTVKQGLEKDLINNKQIPPFMLAMRTAVKALVSGLQPSQQELLAQISGLDYDNVLNFSRAWSRKLFAQSFVSGNLNTDIGSTIYKSLLKHMIRGRSVPLQKKELGKLQTLKLPSNQISIIQKTVQLKGENNCALLVYYQFQPQSFKNNVLHDFIYNFISQFAFNYFRIKQQIGFVVQFSADNNRGILGFNLLLQSTTKNGEQLVFYVDKFFNQVIVQELKKLQTQEFEQLKDSMRTQLLDEDQNLLEQTDYYWMQIKKHSYAFQRKQIQINQIKQLTLEQFKRTFRSIFYQNAKRFEVHIHGHQNTNENLRINLENKYRKQKNIKIYKNIDSFRKSKQFYPDLYAYK